MAGLLVKGPIWVLGDDVDTDQIVPGKVMAAPVEEQAKHVLEALLPGFAAAVKPGDILVAGRNFGCGSSREGAPRVLAHVGVAAVIAESFARIFFRNAIAIGLPVLVCPGLAAASSRGDEVEVDLESARVSNLTADAELAGEPLNDFMIDSLRSGGIMELLAAEYKSGSRG